MGQLGRHVGVRRSLVIGSPVWVCALCVACQSDGAPPNVRVADAVRILAYNIHHGEGMDSVLDLTRIADLIRRVEPDLITLQELDSRV